MATRPSLDAREQALTDDLMDVLTDSEEDSELLYRTHEVLAREELADYLALCVSRPGQPAGYDWVAPGMPTEFFGHYPELVHEDFVRDAVMRNPGMVLRDTEMVSEQTKRQSG